MSPNNVDVIIFSRDRPAQLDLLLRSLRQNAPDYFQPVKILWTASDATYELGYQLLMQEFPWATWGREVSFEFEVRRLIDLTSLHVMFLCDDNVFYQRMENITSPVDVLKTNAGVICFSLRLGQHTGICYPLNRLQGLPVFEEDRDVLYWPWRTGDSDWGYPGSLDGHIWRKSDLLDLIADGHFENPNQLEDVLVNGCKKSLLPTMACYHRSKIVGIPVNRTSQSHFGNRYGKEFFESERMLNASFLDGRRLSLSSVVKERVTGAHTEFKLKYV